MLTALNEKGIKVYANDTGDSAEFYCPVCGERLVFREGTKKRHHFAHYPGRRWVHDRAYEMMNAEPLEWNDAMAEEQNAAKNKTAADDVHPEILLQKEEPEPLVLHKMMIDDEEEKHV